MTAVTESGEVLLVSCKAGGIETAAHLKVMQDQLKRFPPTVSALLAKYGTLRGKRVIIFSALGRGSRNGQKRSKPEMPQPKAGKRR